MEDVTDVTIGPCEKSRFIRPINVEYRQNGQRKLWDAINVQPGVLILIYNSTRDVLVFVKQFRPAVYASDVTSAPDGTDPVTCIDHAHQPAECGMTLELCAGLVDKNKPLLEIARDEILEECGYDVPLGNIRTLTEYRDDPDIAGVRHVIYFAAVTDAMRAGPGGGVPEEGEFIEVVEVPAVDAYDVIMADAVQKPFSVAFAVLWFYENVYKKSPHEQQTG